MKKVAILLRTITFDIIILAIYKLNLQLLLLNRDIVFYYPGWYVRKHPPLMGCAYPPVAKYILLPIKNIKTQFV